MSEVSKKKIRVIGINRGRDLKAYGKQVEKAMNELIEDGYRVEPHEEPNGVLLMAQLKGDESEQREHPLARLLGGGAMLVPIGQQSETTDWNPRTTELIKRFANIVQDEEHFAKDMAKHMTACTAGFSVFWTAFVGVAAQAMQANLQ